MDNQITILVLYDTKNGNTKELAHYIAQGVEQAGAIASIRRVPSVSSTIEKIETDIPEEGDLYATNDDLLTCHGLALGSPTHFGNMTASMKYFIDGTVSTWLSGSLQDKPACVFTSSGSMHGGQESTLLTMMLPLMHHGMLMVGLPYSEPSLTQTMSGGTPYGVSKVSGTNHDRVTSQDEITLAIAQGKRLADIAIKLAN